MTRRTLAAAVAICLGLGASGGTSDFEGLAAETSVTTGTRESASSDASYWLAADETRNVSKIGDYASSEVAIFSRTCGQPLGFSGQGERFLTVKTPFGAPLWRTVNPLSDAIAVPCSVGESMTFDFLAIFGSLDEMPVLNRANAVSGVKSRRTLGLARRNGCICLVDDKLAVYLLEDEESGSVSLCVQAGVLNAASGQIEERVFQYAPEGLDSDAWNRVTIKVMRAEGRLRFLVYFNGELLSDEAYYARPQSGNGQSVTALGFDGCALVDNIFIGEKNPAFSGNGLVIEDHVVTGWTPVSGTDVVIPEGVTAIAYGAFKASDVTSVVFPDSLKEIGVYAFFECESLTNVTFGSGLQKIDRWAFCCCSSLWGTFVVPEGVTEVGFGAFMWSAIEELVFPASLTKLGAQITLSAWTRDIWFKGNAPALPAIELPAYPQQSSPFCDMSDDLVIHVAAGTTGWLDETDALPDEWPAEYTPCPIVSYDGFPPCGTCTRDPFSVEGEYWKDPITGIWWAYTVDESGATILGVSQSGRTLIVPETLDGHDVTAIGNKAFAWLGVETVIVPGNIKTVGANAFSNCRSLAQVDFEGEPPTGLGAAGFPATTLVRYNDAYETSWQTALADAGLTNVSSYHPLMDLDWEYESCEGGVRITGVRTWGRDIEPGEVRVPSAVGYSFYSKEPVREIGGGMMWSWGIFGTYEDSFATSITIPDGVRVIGDYVFNDCYSLTTVRIPESVTRIGMQAFCSCTNLTNITLPKRLQTIDTHAFSSCNSLSEITIPAAVTNIGNGAFYPCMKLASIEVEDGNPSYVSIGGVLYDKDVRTLIQCPALVSTVEIPKTVKIIGTSAFFWCSKITSLHIPASVEEIGRFAGCDSLTELTVDAKNKCFSVRDGVLYDYGKKTLVCCLPTCKAVDIPQTVVCVDDGGFLGCSNLVEIVLPANLRAIGADAFEECRSLKSITIPSGVQNIPDMGFYNCRNLKEIQLLGSVTNIGRSAFHSCRSLESVTLPTTLEHVGDSAFEWCESLALTFEGAPPQVDGTGWSEWSGPFSRCTCGYYSAFREEWEAEIDVDGKWHGLDMYYEGPEDSGVASFIQSEASAAKGGAFRLTVYGGSEERATSVKVAVAYGNAKAADLVLKNATVSGADGVEMTNLKFPLTLSWAQGDTDPKAIVIPVAAGKATDAPKFLAWNLTDAKGIALGEATCCIGRIAAGEKWNGEDVYVMPTVADAAGGKVSGGASVKPDKKGAYKAVTLKATPNKGYWFAGWYGADGERASGDLSFKVAPDGESGPLSKYEARFVPAQPALSGTYNGYARVNLRGMTVVKGADTSADVYGDCPITVTLSSAGKLSGSATVAGNKVSFKCDGPNYVEIDEDGVTWANFMVMLDEKAMFGCANKEVAEIILSDSQFGTGVIARNVEGDYAPFGSPKSYADLMRNRSKDASVKARLKTLSGTYAGYAADSGGRVVPLSVVVDAAGKAKVAGKFHDGTALSASTVLGGYGEDLKGQHVTDWWSYGNVFLSVKSLGKGNLHLELSGFAFDGEDIPRLQFTEVRTTSYSSVAVAADDINLCDRVVSRFSSGCWCPADADPDFGVVRLTSGEDTIDILYASKNGKITGLGKALQSGFTVKFDAKTGLLTVTKGKAYTIQGVLGDYASGCYRAGRINADKTCESVYIAFTTLTMPDESFPWTADGFELTLGQAFGEGLQPSVESEDGPLALTVTGLPAGLKYDKKTGLITGAPTKAGTFKVKVGYTYATRKITRETTLVVNPKPERLPIGTYAGSAAVYVDGTNEGQRVDCPFTATIDKNGALSGSITLFGKKATFKASGYGCGSEGSSDYTATLDLKAVDKTWGTAALSLWVEGDEMSAEPTEPFGDGAIVNGVVAYRNQTKDAGYADRVAPYVGTYVAALSTTFDADRYGVTTLSATVDKKGTVKLAGTFADGTAFTGSAPLALCEGPDGEWATVNACVAPKSLAQGGMRISLSFYEEDGTVMLEGSAIAAKYARTDGEYVESSLVCDWAYRYSSLAWVDGSVNPNATCLSVWCDNGSFDEAHFAWKMKDSKITGVDKRLSGPSMTFKIDDKTGLFSGTCGSYKIFGAMSEGSCSGIGTAVGKDGSVDWVWVEWVKR